MKTPKAFFQTILDRRPRRAWPLLSLFILPALIITSPLHAQSGEIFVRKNTTMTEEGYRQRREYLLSADSIIIKFKSSLQTSAANLTPGRMNALSATAGIKLKHGRRMSGKARLLKLDKSMTRKKLKAIVDKLSARSDVEYASINTRFMRTATPNDSEFSRQWNFTEATGGVNLPSAWDLTTNAGAVLAVLDTGSLQEFDIKNRLLAGYDFITDVANARDGNARDSNSQDEGDFLTGSEGCGLAAVSSWHGTHVAGIVAAQGNNGVATTGVNWSGFVLPVRVLGRCGGSEADIVDAIRWAAGISVSGVPDNQNPAKAINLSLGGTGSCSAAFQSAIDDAVAAGAVVVVAAGNLGGSFLFGNLNTDPETPSVCNNVISVAATKRNGGRASYSSTGTAVDIAAPGGDDNAADSIWSTVNEGDTVPVTTTTLITIQAQAGTSQAAPHVTGVVGLMITNIGSLTPTQITNIMQFTARTFPTSTGDDCTTGICGSGILDAHKSVRWTRPSVGAGVFQIVSTGTTGVQLNGSATSGFGSIGSVKWVQTGGTGITFSNDAIVNPTFTAPNTEEQLDFSLSATDNVLLTSTNTTFVIVRNPPVAIAGPDQGVNPGSFVQLSGAGISTGGLIVGFSWTQTAGNAVVIKNGNTAAPTFTANAGEEVLTFQITVTDDLGQTASYSMNVLVISAPQSIIATTLGVSSITFSWDAVGLATDYRIFDASDDTILNTQVGTAYTWTGRTPNTSYRVKVTARFNGDQGPIGISPSTFTHSVLATSIVPTPHITSMTITYAYSGTSSGFIVIASTQADFATEIDSVLSANTGAGSIDLTGLIPGQTYFMKLGALNGSGGAHEFPTNPATVFLQLNVLLLGSPEFSGISTGTITYNWLPGDNPSGQTYTAEVSTASDFTGGGDQTVVGVDIFAAGFSGLSVNTTYFLQVKSPTSQGLQTSTPTFALSPSSASPVFIPVDQTSVTVSWGAGGNPAGTHYLVQVDNDPNFGSPVSSRTENTAAVFSGLSANTTYYSRVQTVSLNGDPVPEIFLTMGSTMTVPGQPSFNEINIISSTSITALGTPIAASGYLHQISDDPLFGTVLDTKGTSLQESFHGLSANTSYYLRFAGLNPIGGQGAYSAVSTTMTFSAAPVPVTLLLTSRTAASMRVEWGANTNPSGTDYVAELSSHSDFSSAVQSSRTANLHADFGGLWANTTNYLRVKTVNSAETHPDFSAYTDMGAVGATLTHATTAQAFSYITYSSVNILWTALPTTPSSRTAQGYRVEVSTAMDFTGTIFGSTVAGGASSTTAIGGLNHSTTYYLRIGALNHNFVSSFTVLGTTRTLIPVFSSSPFAGGTTTYSLVPPYAAFESVSVILQAGTLPLGTDFEINANVELDKPPSASNQGELKEIGPGIGFRIETGGVQPRIPVTILMKYDPAQLPAWVNPRRIVMGRFDEPSNSWTLLPTQVNVADNIILGRTDHFSFFAPFQFEGNDLFAAVHLFPIPWMPGSDNSSHNATNLTFTNLPDNTALRIYTIKGELLIKLDAGLNGIVTWDGKTRFGIEAGTGTYLVVMEADGKSGTSRIVIIR